MIFKRSLLLIVIVSLSMRTNTLNAQTFPNGNKSVFVISNKISQSAQLYTYNATAQTLTNLGSQGTRKINALGYNPADNYLYAVESMGYGTGYQTISTQGKILRINSSGAVSELGYFTYPGGTSQGKQFLCGTFDLSGNYYLYDTEDMASSKKVFKISNIASGNLTATVITPGQSLFFTDFTFNPYDSSLYALGGSGSRSNTETNRIIKIDPNTGVTTFVTPTNGSIDQALRPSFYDGAGAVWSDDEGNIFFYNNGGYVIRYNLLSTQYNVIGTAMPHGFDGDAAANISPSLFKDPAVSVAFSANGISATSTTTLTNLNTQAAPGVVVSTSLSATIAYSGFAVKNAQGNIVPPAAQIYTIVSQPSINLTGGVLTLHFNTLLPGTLNQYTIEMNGNRVNPNTQEQLSATAQITSINDQVLNNNNLQNNTDNISWVVGDNAHNNDASAVITTTPLSINEELSNGKRPIAFSSANKIYLDPNGIACYYEIFNSNGKRIGKGELQEKKTFVPGTAGVYLIKLSYGNNITKVTKVAIY